MHSFTYLLIQSESEICVEFYFSEPEIESLSVRNLIVDSHV